MMNNNKILTVSYGTFSCTLEGFDDSFGTMKVIAEYFRDLASDDRYFGAEPPQPDPQMLARIAEREVSRHVDAREDDGRIVLSARDLPKATALAATQPASDKADEVEEAQIVEDEAQTPEPPEEVNNATRADTAEIDLAEDDFDADDALNDEDADEVGQTDNAAETVAVDDPDIVPSLPDADVEAFFADGAAAEIAQEAAPVAAQAGPAQARADSIAEKLKRIRAVVSQQPDEDDAPDYSEDQHADGSASKAAAAAALASVADAADADEDEDKDVLADTLRDIEDALEEDDAVDQVSADVADEDDLEDDDDDISAILSRLEAESDEQDEDDTLADISEEDDFPEDDYLDGDFDADSLSDNIMAAMDRGADTSDAEDDAEADAQGDENLFEDEAPAPVAAKPEAPKPAEKPQAPEKAKAAAPRTRVLKVKRATLEAAINSGQLEEYDDDSNDAAEPAKAAAAAKSSLSDEAEEELARELAELEADMKAGDANAFEDDFDDNYEDELEEAPAPRAQLNEAADENFSRLMEETEQQMGEPEGTTRRDAFAHLRAAVAAKKADEAVGGGNDTVESDEAYRDDLANVVRPRRPASKERSARTERPAEQRPAPLKLVAEQRIDTAEPRRVTPVRPRRVAASAAPAPEAEPSEVEGSFADFATDMGATQLPDLLEAAAAYLSFVEGQAEFSRPQLMTKVRQVEKDNFTREDGLRSFGKLLREGKIEKLKGGRFQASDQIGFKPDARAAS